VKLAIVERTIFEKDVVDIGKSMNFKTPVNKLSKKQTIIIASLEKKEAPTNNL
jgi:hypothetical protein